jgi:hypothetical protein
VSSEPGDTKLHAYRNIPAEPATLDNDCGLPPDQPWIVGPSPTLADDFACIASTKSGITTEHTAANAAGALTHPANAGFLRDDAVLVVVMLTDEDEQSFDLSRVEIRDTILGAVDDRLERVVVLSIAGDPGVFEMPKTTCVGTYGNAAPGRRLADITRSFRDQGIVQDICAGDLAQAFTAALADVIDTCENFTPEG